MRQGEVSDGVGRDQGRGATDEYVHNRGSTTGFEGQMIELDSLLDYYGVWCTRN